MALRHLPARLARQATIRMNRWLGRDHVTGRPVRRRANLVSIGSKYGGWIVPTDRFDADSICYCVGCGEDITFDLGLIERFGCDVHGFDPTPRSIAHVAEVAGDNPRYHFAPIGLWNQTDTLRFYAPQNEQHVSHSLVNLQKTETYIEVEVERLSRVMQERGHDRLDLLKLDIEGAEYTVIDSIIEDGLDIGVLCVEYDECFSPQDDDYVKRIDDSIGRLLDFGYELVCAEGDGNYTFVKG